MGVSGEGDDDHVVSATGHWWPGLPLGCRSLVGAMSIIYGHAQDLFMQCRGDGSIHSILSQANTVPWNDYLLWTPVAEPLPSFWIPRRAIHKGLLWLSPVCGCPFPAWGKGANRAHYQGTKPAEWEHDSAGRLFTNAQCGSQAHGAARQ